MHFSVERSYQQATCCIGASCILSFAQYFSGATAVASGVAALTSYVAASVFASVYGATAASVIFFSAMSAATLPVFLVAGNIFLITSLAFCALGCCSGCCSVS